MMVTMNPSISSRLTEAEAYDPTNESVYSAVKKNGEDAMITFLRPHVVNLIRYTRKQIPEDDVLNTIAQSLLQASKDAGCSLKELLYFFNLVKMAHYGEMTGAFDGIKLLAMFQKHKKERRNAIRRVEEEQRRLEELRGIRHDGLENKIRYLRRLMFAKTGDEEARRWFADIMTTDTYGRPQRGIPWWEDQRSVEQLDAEITKLMRVQEEQKRAQNAQKGTKEAINPFM